MPDAAREWHVASLVVRHRPDAIAALANTIGAAEGLELALQDQTRSVLVQESDGTAGLMRSIDLLNAVPGVYAVNLVYHHIEPLASPGPVGAPPEPQEPPR
ncbi:chaperone NapD [Luteimonas saliphila]|uniref:chaperone NapD n=1 Tax=Luteimonas saliphila TaxID=2804919 RepID=UPI00192E2C10|nr:chaperone NapD [Luteimonas saliphila]